MSDKNIAIAPNFLAIEVAIEVYTSSASAIPSARLGYGSYGERMKTAPLLRSCTGAGEHFCC